MADFGGGFGQPPVQVIEQRGGGTLNFIRSVLESRERDKALEMARKAYEPVARTIADQIDAGDYNGASRVLSRQYYELDQMVRKKYPTLAAEVASATVKPGFDHLVYLSRQGAPGGMIGGAETAGRFDPSQGPVKLSQVAKNTEAAKSSRALGGLRAEQTETERTMRPLVASGQMATTGLRGAQAGAAQATAGYRGFQTETLGPAQADAAKAQAEADRARAAQPPSQKAGPQPQTPRLIQSFQRKLADMQDIGKMGLADSERASAQMQGELDVLNTMSEREGFPDRFRMKTVGGAAVLETFSPGQAQGIQMPPQMAQPPPTATPASMPGLGPPPPIPEATQGMPPPTPTMQMPQAPAPAAAPGDVMDLSRLIPESVAALAAGKSVGASQVVAELGKQGITDPAKIREILGLLAASSGQ